MKADPIRGAVASPSTAEKIGGFLVSRLRVIVFADAAGFSTAMNRDEVATIHTVEQALAQFVAHSQKLGGKVLNYTGDGAFAAFESAASAATFAIKFQEGLARSSTDISFRVGIHLGEVFSEKGHVYGDCINIAQRLQALAPSGGIYISDLVYRALRSRSDFTFEFVGEKLIKNIPEPINVYQLHSPNVAASLKPSPRQSPETIHRSIDLTDAERPSIAVLPFRNLSGDQDQEFFAEGIADDIITSLCKFRGVDVIARGSSFAFRDRSIPLKQIGQQLQTRYIAEGSVRRAGHRIRVSVELSDVISARMIWAERYDRPLEDIFILQDEIASLAVAAISASIDSAEQQRWKTAPPDSLRAYGLVLKGTSHIHNYTARDNDVARSYFERALENAPDYARSFAGLSRTYNLSWRYSWADDPRRSLERAFDLAVQAVEADSNDARGHAELGFVQLYRREHDRSLACYERALMLNPNEANIIAEYGDALAHAGNAAASLEHFDRAMRLNPLYPDTYLWYKAGALTKLRRFEEAISTIYGMNNPAQGRRLLACCYAYLGRLDDARHEAELILAAQPGFNADHWAREVVPDRRDEDIELFAAGLRAAGL